MTTPRRCDRFQRHLPAYVTDNLSSPRRRLVARHLRRCDECIAEESRQRLVAADLQRLSDAAENSLAAIAPPDDLLGAILKDAGDPGLRGRAAVPVRGAVSGARPGLTAVLVVTVLSLAAAAAWAGWRLGRVWASREQR